MSSICVIGGANIDIVGSSIDPLQNYDSNPGEISIAYGGHCADLCTTWRKYQVCDLFLRG